MVEGEREAEGAVGVRPGPDRVRRSRQMGHPVVPDDGDGRGQGVRPGRSLVVGPSRQLIGELHEPRPPVRALERGPVAQVRRLDLEVLHGEGRPERLSRGIGGGPRPPEAQQAHEEPMLVDARVPVIAPEERRMERARRPQVARTAEEMSRGVRILAVDVVDRDARHRGRELVGEVDPHRWRW
jgi:hypothetical protein